MTTQKSRVRSLVRNVADIAGIVLLMLAAKTAIAEPYYVPSGSMEPTLMIGDELLASKFPYGYGAASLPAFVSVPGEKRIFAALPERGDVVVFRWPGDKSKVWVKRVIGLPGDRITLNRGRVIINGKPVGISDGGVGDAEDENGGTISAARFLETLPGGHTHTIYKLAPNGPYDSMAETTVPPGHLFVMGDNRDNSADSRVPVASGGVGMLPVANLVGRVDAIIGSWDLGLKDKPVWTWPSGLRLSRFFTAVQ